MSTPIPSLGNKTPEQLRVAELREELKKRGINIKGLKKDLVERLDEILRQEAAEAEADADESKKSSPEQVSDQEETFAVTSGNLVDVDMQAAKEDAPVKEGDLEATESVPEYDLKSGSVGPFPEENESFPKVKEVETNGPDVTVAVSEFASKDKAAAIEPTATGKSLLEADIPPSPRLDDDPKEQSESGPAVEGVEDGNTFESEANVEPENVSDEKLDSGTLAGAEDKLISYGRVESISPAVDLEYQVELLKPFQRSHPASSTDAIIIEASEAEVVPASSNVALSEWLHSTEYGARIVEEEDSAVEETGGEPTQMKTAEITTVETVSVVTETTVVTTETVVLNEIEADFSTVESCEGSFNQRFFNAGTHEEAEDEKKRVRYEDGMEVEEGATAKDSKHMEIDSDRLTAGKRKDGEELRQQEPTKRQRRWNSDKSIGASADVIAPIEITTDTFKEAVTPEGRPSSQAPVAPYQSTTTSSIPKASAASTSFDKPASLRPVPFRTDILVNGDVDKKREVPPPSRGATVSLKIDRFVRPFTIKAVRELLEQTGTVKEMWMDQIKTHCYVTYSSVEEATATRNGLYGLQWPLAGGKLLIAEFVEPEEVTTRIEGITDKPAPTPVTTPRGSANSSAQGAGITLHAVNIPTSGLPPPPPLPPPPRERPALPPKKELEPPIPTLDDLFKKTRTKPQIYFLPLTEEQVSEKLRNKHHVNKASVKA